MGATLLVKRRADKRVVTISERSLSKISSDALAVTLVGIGLIAGQQYVDQQKHDLVMEAFKSANPRLSDMGEGEIGQYLAGLSESQLRGVISNTKGKYHEMLYAESVDGELHEELNQPGSDVILSDGGEVQLKATDSVAYIREHQEKYPEVGVVATEEVSEKLESVESSGFSNVELEADVAGVLESVSSSADVATEAVSATVVADSIGFTPVGIVVGLLTGFFF